MKSGSEADMKRDLHDTVTSPRIWGMLYKKREEKAQEEKAEEKKSWRSRRKHGIGVRARGVRGKRRGPLCELTGRLKKRQRSTRSDKSARPKPKKQRQKIQREKGCRERLH